MFELKAQRREILDRLNGIDTRLENVTTQVSTIKDTLKKTNHTLEKQKQRVDATEERISILEDTLQATQRELHRTEKVIQTLETKVDVLSNKERMKCLVLLGLPEKSEREQALIYYIQQKLQSWLKLPMNKPLELEQAMCSGRTPPESGKSPRPVLIRFFTDQRQTPSCKKKPLMREGERKITIHQDLPVEVRQKRKEFDQAIQVLIKKGMFRGFAYPHHLRVLHDNNIILFNDPKEVDSFVRNPGPPFFSPLD